MKRIYLDYASLTPIDPRVIREMKKYSSADFANPSSLYKEGVAANKALEEARASVAEFLHAHADEVVFTSGGTEANGLAIEGAGRTAHRNGFDKPHVIISAIEHSSVMETAAMMERHGTEVTRLPVDANGIVSLEELKKALKPNTFMVSIMTVNNEIGSIQPLKEIAKIVRDYRKSREPSSTGHIPHMVYPLFHTDAAQAVLYEDLNMERLGVDLLTLDGSKSYGPHGIGCLYVRRGTPIEQIIYGGGQERGLRSGTENIPAVKGFAKSLEIADKEKKDEAARLAVLRMRFFEGLKAVRSDISINPAFTRSDKNFRHFGKDVSKGVVAHAAPTIFARSTPHILNVSIPGIDNEFFVLQLDAKGAACSTKSSCLRDEDESYVLKAIGADSKMSVRFSFGRWTKKGDIDRALKLICQVLSK